MRLVGDGAAVAACPMRRGGGFLPDAARRWLLARCGAAEASCLWLRCHLSSNVLRTDSYQSFGNVEQDVANRGQMSRNIANLHGSSRKCCCWGTFELKSEKRGGWERK